MFGLTIEGCRERQERLKQHLSHQNVDAALIFHPHLVHYFSGYWRAGRDVFSMGLVIPVDGPVTLATGVPAEHELAIDQARSFPCNKLATFIDDQPAALINELQPDLSPHTHLGVDQIPRAGLLDGWQTSDINPTLFQLRRTKFPDELQVLREVICATQAAYECAAASVRPGITEIEMYAKLRAAAINDLGEPLTAFGNDFCSGEPGGLPRNRPMKAGELVIYDLSVVGRGYSSDMCRTFAVDGQPTDAQLRAHELVVGALKHVENRVKPGVSCRELYNEVHEMLDGKHGWSFPHHLGHGIGLGAHEAPRLNPNWDDTFQVGDVFTAEPGLYGGDLNAGIRIENNYLVTADGIERLTDNRISLTGE